MSKYESLEAAKEAQELKAQQVKDAKAALATYFKENKLKKTEDYSEDAKQGKKVTRLEAKVDKYSNELITINEDVKSYKPGKAKKEAAPRNLKYDYPEDVKTAEQRKKYRIEQRKVAKGGEEGAEAKPAKAAKAKKAKKETKPEVETEEEVEIEDTKPTKKGKKTAKVADKAPAKKTSKKRKEVIEEDTEEDD